MKFETVTSRMWVKRITTVLTAQPKAQLKPQKKNRINTNQTTNKLFNETAWDRNESLIWPSWFAEQLKATKKVWTRICIIPLHSPNIVVYCHKCLLPWQGFHGFPQFPPDKYRDITLQKPQKLPLTSCTSVYHSYHSVMHRAQTTSSIRGPSKKLNRLLYHLTMSRWKVYISKEALVTSFWALNRALAETE
jgi:hypothetical protein